MGEGSWTPAGTGGNWVWLVPNLADGPAIYVGDGTSVLPDGLRLHTSEVIRVTPESAMRPGTLEPGAAALAMVELDSLPAAPADAHVFQALRHALAPSGCFCLSLMAGRGLIGRWKADRRMRRLQRDLIVAGFRPIAHQYAVPDVTSPIAIIPATRSGSLFFEMLTDTSPVAWLRLTLARLGLHPLLYRGHMVLCYR